MTSFLSTWKLLMQVFLAQTHCSMALCNAFPISDKNVQKFIVNVANKLKNPVCYNLAIIGKYIFSTIQYLIHSSKFRSVFSILSYLFYQKWTKLLTTSFIKQKEGKNWKHTLRPLQKLCTFSLRLFSSVFRQGLLNKWTEHFQNFEFWNYKVGGIPSHHGVGWGRGGFFGPHLFIILKD